MNNTFNISRFISFERRNFIVFRKYLLIILATVVGLYLLSMVSWFANERNISTNAFSLIFIIIIGLIIIIPFLTEQEINKNKAVFNYTLPVSVFERLLGMVMKYAVIIPAICIIMIYLIDKISVFIEYDKYVNSYYTHNGYDMYKNYLNLNSLLGPTLLLIYGVQSFFLYGYMYFKKNALFKTCLIFFLLLYFLPVSSTISTEVFAGERYNDMINSLICPWSTVESWATPSLLIIVIDILFKILFSFGMWLVLYRKIKEIEI